MTLRRRTALVILVSCVLASVVLYFTLQSIVTTRFAALERQQAQQDLGRASSALDQDAAGLDATVADWASRDDTYEFMQDGGAEYISGNLGEATFSQLGIDFVVFVSTAGQIAYSAAIDPSDGMRTPILPSLEQHVTGDRPLARHPGKTSSVAGVLLLPEQGVLVASRPIVTRDQTGPIAGSLVMGRYLGDSEMQPIAEATGLSLELHRIDEAEPAADVEAARSDLSAEHPSVVRTLDAGTVAAYALVPDIYGNPALVLRMDEPRDVYAQGQQITRYLLYFLLGSTLAISLLATIGIDRLVLARLRRLSASVGQVAQSQNASGRVSVGGKDELTALANTINGMLGSLEQSHRSLVETEAKNRALIDAMPDLMFRANREGRIIEGSWPLRARPASGNGGSQESSREMPDRDLVEMLPAHIQDLAAPHIQKAFESRETQVFEFQMEVGDRSCHYEARVVASTDADVLIIVRDVTERKHEEEARQKSLLLKEIHHRVKNNLQVISGLLYLQARRTKDKKLVEVLNESSNRVKSVALIHQRLQQSKDTVSVELSEYIRDLTTVLLHSRGRDSSVVKLGLDLEKNVVISIDTAVPCGLIVNELVSNSLKHAFPDGRPGKIHISLHTDEADAITLVISDNGVGLPADFDINKADSLGLQLVVSLASQLGASIETANARGGTEFIIRFREDTAPEAGKVNREAERAGTASGDRR